MVQHELWSRIAKEERGKKAEGLASVNRSVEFTYLTGEFADKHYHELHLKIAKELGDRNEEGAASRDLGNAYYRVGEFNKAIEYHDLHLKISKELEDRVGEGQAYANLGVAYECLGDLKKAIEYHELHLRISKEIEDRYEEGKANSNLGKAYHIVGDFKKAIHYHHSCLNIFKDVGDRDREAQAYGSLGDDYKSIGNFWKAIQNFDSCLKICKEVGNVIGEGSAYGGLGGAYSSLGDFRKAIVYLEGCVKIARTVRNKVGEGCAYADLGDTFNKIGNVKKAIDYHERALKIFKQEGYQAGEGRACHSLGNSYRCIRDFKKALNYHERQLNIFKQLGDKVGEGYAYSSLGNVYYSLQDFKTAVEYHKRSLEIATEVGNPLGVGNEFGNLGQAYLCLGDAQRAKECHECHLRIAQAIGDRIGEAKTYFGLGCSLQLLGYLEDSFDCFQASVNILNGIKAGDQFVDEWKISLRHMYQQVYTRLWLLLLTQNKVREALFAAEQGRAQALKDLMEINYGLKPSSIEYRSLKEITCETFHYLPSVFTAVHGDEITFWVLQNGKDVYLRKKKIEDNSSPKDVAAYLQSLMQSVREAIGVRAGAKCKDRLGETYTTNTMCEQSKSHSLDHHEHPLKTLYDVAVSPIADLIDGDELVIIPEGPLCLAPYAAFMDSNSKQLCESFRIRMLPSLTTLKLIKDCPAGYHCKSGALLVGDPWVQDVVSPEGGKLQQLPYAREEVEVIGRILNTVPLTGTEATKTEVLKRLASVALVHIAAHGRMETGEIALSPDPSLSHQIPKEKDYLLTMTDVLNVKLRARLVVLSCCHSGRGSIKAEGVVGIARAFLGAGARSVLVSLWAIDDEATLEFMKCFYQNLAEGRSASEALNRAMNFMRKSDKFCEVRFWAPFVLTGDDVTLEFGGNQ